MTGVTPAIALKRHHQNPRHGVSHPHAIQAKPDALALIERELSNIREAVARCRVNAWSPSRTAINYGAIVEHATRIKALAKHAVTS